MYESKCHRATTKQTASGQNTIGIYIIPLALIQNTAHKQNTVCNNQLLELHPAITD